MVDVSSITGMTVNNQQTTADSNQLSADMNTFLTLLTTQLQYQDPMDPMDTAQFTQQLVQYSQVEQSIAQNEKLDELLAINVSNLGAQAVSYIGKTAQVLGDVMPMEDGVANATYSLDKNVTSTTIMVKNMEGDIVYSQSGNITAGNHDFKWDGKDSNGVQLEDGAYQILVSTNSPEGEDKAVVTTTVFGRVSGVASDESGVYVGLGDAVTATLADILTIRDGEYSSKDTSTDTDADSSTDEGTSTESETI